MLNELYCILRDVRSPEISLSVEKPHDSEVMPCSIKDVPVKVSIVIPVYNAEKYLEECVVSAAGQKETGEVILVEDNSPDGSLDVCRLLEEKFEKVVLVRHPGGVNRGASASRNLGISMASFDYVAFLDADDYYLPGRFKLTCKLFQENSEIDGVYEATGIFFKDGDAKQRWKSLNANDLTMLQKEVAPEDLCDVLIRGGRGDFHLNGLTVRRELFERCGYFPDDIHMHEDTLLMTKMSYYGNLLPGRLDEPVAVRRVHETNRSVAEFNTYRTRYVLWKRLFEWAINYRITADIKTVIFLNYLYCVYCLAVDRYSEGSKDLKKLAEFAAAVLMHPILSAKVIRERFQRKSEL